MKAALSLVFCWCLCALPALGANISRWPMLTSAPLVVEAGQEVTVCVANLSNGPVDAQLSLFNVRTGETISQREDRIPNAGGTGKPSNPCLGATPGNALVAARVSIRGRWNGLPPRGVSASLQVTSGQGGSLEGGPGQVHSGPVEGSKRSNAWVSLEWSGLPLSGRRY